MTLTTAASNTLGLGVGRSLAIRRRVAVLAILAASILVYVVPLLVGENHRHLVWWSDCSMTLAAVAVTLKCIQSARRSTDHEQAAWYWIALGMGSWTLGSAVWGIYEIAWNRDVPTLSLADPLLLALPILFAAGLWKYRTRFQPIGVTFLEVGNLGIIFAAILIIQIFLFFGVIRTAPHPRVAVLIEFLYPVLNASAFFFGLVTVSLYLRGRRRSIMLLLLLGLATLCGTEVLVADGMLWASYSSASPLNMMYMAALAFFYWAAFEQGEFALRDAPSEFESDIEVRVKRARQWETLIPTLSVASVLAIAFTYYERVTPNIVPYVLSALVLFTVAIGLRDWWSHRVESMLREQAVASEAELQSSENLLKDKNAELANANLELGSEMKTRMQIQEELRQSQKMEALGQLTGGVAHDFNNLLSVILGNLELIDQGLESDCELRTLTSDAVTASERGAALTRHLLAFSRKQALTPTSFEVSGLLEEMRTLLVRTLGETIRIEIETSPDLWPCVADPAQLENALLNLAINARDAMPEGGSLAIRASNATFEARGSTAGAAAKSGDYVLISVRDSGVGMSADEKARAFEPFYTTKDVGEGSGLGLSMVYGFAKQSEGDVAIRSEPGVGTTVDLYLPRAEVSADSVIAGATRDFSTGQGERILVVEDEPAVRKLVVTLLEDLGYEVFQAADGAAALAALGELDSIQLLLSDVVLPGGLSGPRILSEARRVVPGIKTLLMSGYAEGPRCAEDEVEEAAEILCKPFKKLDLAAKIRSVLESDL